MRTTTSPELLARYAKGPVEQELARFAALPPAKQELVESRLRGIAEYRGDHGAGASVAKRLGLSPRSLYRLAARVAEVGPVEALAPVVGAGRKRRSDAAALPPAAEALLTSLLADRPDASLGELVRAIGEVEGPRPTNAAIRRRAMELRRGYVPPHDAVVGRSLVVDQVAVALPVAREEGVEFLVADVLLCAETRLILGTAPARPPWGRAGRMGELLRSARDELVGLSSPWPVAERIGSLSWVVDDEVDDAAAARVVEIGRVMEPPVSVSLITKGKLRRGSRIIGLIGDRLLSVDLLQRATVDPRTPAEVTGMGERVARSALRSLGRGWNSEVIHRVGRTARPVGAAGGPLLAQLGSLMAPLVGGSILQALGEVPSAMPPGVAGAPGSPR